MLYLIKRDYFCDNQIVGEIYGICDSDVKLGRFEKLYEILRNIIKDYIPLDIGRI